MDNIKSMTKDKLFRSNMIFFIGTISVSALNYLFHPVLSRLLSVKDFGEVQSIVALVNVTSVILSVLGMVALNIITHKDENQNKNNLVSDLQTIALYIILFFALVIIFFRNFLAGTLHFSSSAPFVLLAILLVIAGLTSFRRFYLQAEHRFLDITFGNIIIALGRVVFGAILVLLGFRTMGAVGGFFIAFCLSFVYVFWKTRGGRGLEWRIVPRFTRELLGELRYGGLILFVVAYVIFITNADIVVVKHFFAPDVAGIYTGISVISSIIYMSTASVAGVLLPSIRRDAPFKENMRIFKKSFIFLLLIGTIGLAVMWFMPALLTRILLGSKFVPDAFILPFLGLVSFTAAISNLFATYFLALRAYILMAVSLIGAGVTILSFSIFHDSPLHVVYGFLYGSTTTMVLLILIYIYHYRRNRTFTTN